MRVCCTTSVAALYQQDSYNEDVRPLHIDLARGMKVWRFEMLILLHTGNDWIHMSYKIMVCTGTVRVVCCAHRVCVCDGRWSQPLSQCSLIPERGGLLRTYNVHMYLRSLFQCESQKCWSGLENSTIEVTSSTLSAAHPVLNVASIEFLERIAPCSKRKQWE